MTWAGLMLVSVLCAAVAKGGEVPAFRLGGLVFGDLYHVASHHTEDGDGATGAVLRRGYLTLDADFSERWFSRLRFEINQAGEFEVYDFEADVKDLYLGTTVGAHRLLFGLSPTPTFDLIESIWGARYLLRTPMDLQGVASRDTGISVQGPLSSTGRFSYRAMVGAGLEFGNEAGDGRKWMGALTWKPADGWSVDLYADYERLSGPIDRRTLQGFVGRQAGALRWGAQYSNQDRQQDPPLELASAFVVGRFREAASLIARVDRVLEPSPSGDNISYLPFDPTARATLLLGGIELRATSHLRVTPNVVVIDYDRDEQGMRPGTDVHLRLTLFLDFE